MRVYRSRTVAGYHTFVAEGPFIDRAFALVRQLPSVEPPPMTEQAVLDEIIAANRSATDLRGPWGRLAG